MDYAKLFKKTLLTEDDQARAPVNISPEPPSDEAAWQQNNPEIVNNQELGSKFDVQGLDKAEIEKYSEIIGKWGAGIQSAIEQLAQMIRFAAQEKLADAPGSDQFSDLIKQAPTLKKDLAGFKSQVEDLEQTVKLAINDANKERKDKINSLG
jgi:hypothetical protein